jgi:hypothetical protein
MSRAAVVKQFVERASLTNEINTTTARKFSEALICRQIGLSDPELSFIVGLFPEIYRDDLRSKAIASGALPDWASG